MGKLLFEAHIIHHKGPTYFYYIEKCGSKYYFKHGISMLGVPINNDENYRLSILTQTEETYQTFKQELFKQAKQYRWSGPGFKHRGHFNFLDEKCAFPFNMDGSKFQIPFYTLMKSFFETPFEELKKDEKKYTIIDHFEVNKRPHAVIHDNGYQELPYKPESELTEDNDNQVLMDFVRMSKDENPVRDIMHTESARREQYDLMREALFIKKFKMYPRRMVMIDGWCAKDLIESKYCDIIEAYSVLTLLRVNKEEGKEKLRQLLYADYSKLFDKELNEIYKARREALIKDQEEQRRSEKLKINEVPTEIEEPQKEKPSNRLGLDFTNMTAEQIMCAVYEDACQRFLSTYTIPMIQKDLQQYIIGQDDLIKHAASFIYYHMLRQAQPELSMRPLLISGPSGSGKTEIWRVAKKLYSNYLEIEIVDGSTITQEGWSGQRKLSSVLQGLNRATILVIDEFDKLASPSYSKMRDNVSHHIQSEFLKLLEGDYTTAGVKDKEDRLAYDPSTLGIVMVGAFERVREEKEHKNDHVVGFVQRKVEQYEEIVPIADEDLISFGVMPEIVGRISDKCTTNKLDAQQYLSIIKNQHSKVNTLIKELDKLGIDAEQVIDDKKIIEIAERSQANMTGVRWVSAQVESELLDLLLNADLRNRFTKKKQKQEEIVFDMEF